MIDYGLGRQAMAIPMDTLEMFLKLLVVSQIIFTTGLMLVKVSILQLYLRIFPSKRFKIAVYIMTGIVLSWWTAITLLTIFQCDPIEMSYKPWLDGHCIDLEGAFYGSGVPDIVVDFLILCLPLRQVWKLNTSLSNKLVIGFFFASGAFATFASINRLIVVFQVDHLNGTWTLVQPLGWAIIEQAAAVVSACLPTLRPLLVKLHQFASPWIGSRPSNQSAQQWNSELVTIGGSSGRRTQDRKFLRLTSEEDGLGLSTHISTAGQRMSNDGAYESSPGFQGLGRTPEGINVQVRRSFERSSAEIFYKEGHNIEPHAK
ncbi:hypothetical protein F5Y13DRAFT_116704 [Hypoxylon sp. FL1857]|nr:hypothetical protein F5Y13DRAFT_116704 [Hypoxylon sp. FL1857]